MLLGTPRVRDFITQDVLAETNAVWRWLCLLATDETTEEMKITKPEPDDEGGKVSTVGGTLKELPANSANMCAEIAAKIS